MRRLNWRYQFIDGQPTSMLIRGGDLRALSVHFCNLAGWAWNVHEKGNSRMSSANAYLDDRPVSADSCQDPLCFRTLEITKQVVIVAFLVQC